MSEGIKIETFVFTKFTIEELQQEPNIESKIHRLKCLKELQMEKNAAKVWAFEHGHTVDEMQKAWDNAIEQNNFIIKNLAQHGETWADLPPHLCKQLLEIYL